MENSRLLGTSEVSSVALTTEDRAGLWHIPSQTAGRRDVQIRYRALLRRHARSILAIVLICLALGLVVTLMITPTYKAKAVVEILPVNEDFMHNKELDPNVASGTMDSYMDTQVRLLTSESVGDRVIASLMAKGSQYQQAAKTGMGNGMEFGKTPKDTFKADIRKTLGSLKVKAEGQSSLISITVSGPSPQITADTANAVAAQHMAALQDARTLAAAQTSDFFNVQLEGLLKKLRNSENELQTYARRTGLLYMSGGTGESVASEKLREIQVDLEKAETDRADKQAQLELANSNAPDALPKVLDDGGLREASSKVADLERQLALLSETYTPNHYRVKEVKSQIAALDKQVEHSRGAIISRIKNDYQTAARRESIQRKEYEQQLALVTDQSAKEVGYNLLKRDVDANRELYQSMLQKIKEAGVMAALRSSNIRIVDRAKVPTLPDQPNLIVNLTIAALAGCMLSVLFILVRERSDGSIRAAGETTRLLQLPELAIIPSARRDIRTQIVSSAYVGPRLNRLFVRQIAPSRSEVSKDLMASWLHSGSVVAESFRSAVASILLWGKERAMAHKVLVVTSAHSSAGKTTSVLNLGMGLAESGRRVLLIDGDLRLPRLGTIFGLEAEAGLTNAVAEGMSPMMVQDLIHETGLAGLHILPSGARQQNVTQILHMKELGKLIDAVRPEYDFILIDSPPALPLTDARLLAQHSDGVILVVRAGATTAEQSLNVQQCFLQDGTYVFGSILNDWDANAEDPGFMNSYLKYASATSLERNGNGPSRMKKRSVAAGE